MRAGGLVRSNHRAVAFFADLRADVAFLGSGGVDVRAGLTDHRACGLDALTGPVTGGTPEPVLPAAVERSGGTVITP